MVSIHLCPPEIEDRVMLGHWEGDLIKGKVTALRWAPCLNDATATSAVEGLSAALNRMPLAVRQSMTYDQGREMAKHAEITQNTGVAIYFSDPHSPWQRGSNENINGLIRQFLVKGTDLSAYSQQQLDEIAYLMNIRPRKRLDWKCPIELMTQVVGMHHAAPVSIQ
jgi:IS30 family transposase